MDVAIRIGDALVGVARAAAAVGASADGVVEAVTASAEAVAAVARPARPASVARPACFIGEALPEEPHAAEAAPAAVAEEKAYMHCMGDALRGQGEDPSQLMLTLDSDGTLGVLGPGWGSMKLKSCQSEEEQEQALDVKIAKKVIDCNAEAETFAASAGAASLTSTMHCMGDALRGQGKDPRQLMLTLDSDGTLGVSFPGWGSMKLKSCQSEEEQALDTEVASDIASNGILNVGAEGKATGKGQQHRRRRRS